MFERINGSYNSFHIEKDLTVPLMSSRVSALVETRGKSDMRSLAWVLKGRVPVGNRF